MNNIKANAAKSWNEKLEKCIADNGFSQDTFAKEFKKKYKHGTQPIVSRWTRVGEQAVDRKTGKKVEIGFPKYECMLELAEFFGVSVGYLTGETDFESFDMEKACKFFDISEMTGKAIKDVTRGNDKDFLNVYLKRKYAAALSYLLTSKYFSELILGICCLATAIYDKKNVKEYLQQEMNEIESGLFEEAMKCTEYGFVEEDNDKPELTPDLLDAIGKIEDSKDNGYLQKIHEEEAERDVKVYKFLLYELYVKLIEDIMKDENLEDMNTRISLEIGPESRTGKIIDNK